MTRDRWTLGFLIVAAVAVIAVALAAHYRYETISGVGEHFYLVDRWTGKTWFILGSVRREVETAPPETARKARP